MTRTVTAWLDAEIQAGRLTPQPVQAEAARSLDAVLDTLEDRRSSTRSWLPWRKKAAEGPARGVYLHGPPGRGKSVLLGAAVDVAETRGLSVQRVHFHAFMSDIHDYLAALRAGEDTGGRGQNTRIAQAARDAVGAVDILAFDEFEVRDPGDAMLLGRVLEAVWAMGTTLMATSNRAPDELYKNGINRQLFLPTIAALKDKTHVISLTGEEDHRRTGGLGQGYMDESRDSQARARFEAAWDEMCSADHEQPADIAVAGRTLHVPRTRGTCARLDAGELIAQAFGPRDALAIADSFQTVFLEGLEPIPAAARDRAKRLTYLIDTLYEAGTTLVVLARGTPAELYGEGDYAFEFRRTASRLEEMTRTAAVHLRSNAA